MKFILTAILLSTSLPLLAESLIHCQEGASGVQIWKSSNYNDVGGGVTYNYSHARIICPEFLEYAIQENKPFICVGFWGMYRDSEKPALVKFIPGPDGYEAQFRTNKSYGYKLVKLKCD